MKKIIVIMMFIILSGILWAGDTAVFVDLGFSANGKTYAFAQYGIQSNTLKPWAEIYIVDVARNNFVDGGRLSYVHDSPVSAGQDGSGAFFRLLTRNTALADRYGLNFMLQGQPLFISPDEPSAPPRQIIEFRDFETGSSYRAELVPAVMGKDAGLTSSFYINLEQTKNGVKKTYTVGTPSVKRALIESYRIRKVIKVPEDGSLIMIIEMKKQNGLDYDIRFMVEALRL